MMETTADPDNHPNDRYRGVVQALWGRTVSAFRRLVAAIDGLGVEP